jgi:hypothetical protein
MAGPGAELRPDQLQYLEWLDALLEGRVEDSRAHGRRMLTGAGVTPLAVRGATSFLLETELAASRPAVARQLLRFVDPEGNSPRHAMERMRLCLLEGDEAGAAEHLRRVLARGRPERVSGRPRREAGAGPPRPGGARGDLAGRRVPGHGPGPGGDRAPGSAR